MTCPVWQQLLDDFPRGLPSGAMEQHALGCPECAARQPEFRMLMLALPHLSAPEVPAGLEDRITAPAGGAGVSEEEALGLGERMAQLVEDLPEVVARLGFARIRPEGERQMLPQLRRVTVQEQIAEERVEPR